MPHVPTPRAILIAVAALALAACKPEPAALSAPEAAQPPGATAQATPSPAPGQPSAQTPSAQTPSGPSPQTPPTPTPPRDPQASIPEGPDMAPRPIPVSEAPCRADIGQAAATRLAERCRMVSPATHPPCHIDNPCDLIQGEIDRACGQYGPGEAKPAECTA